MKSLNFSKLLIKVIEHEDCPGPLSDAISDCLSTVFPKIDMYADPHIVRRFVQEMQQQDGNHEWPEVLTV